jgi:hypothetical protein
VVVAWIHLTWGKNQWQALFEHGAALSVSIRGGSILRKSDRKMIHDFEDTIDKDSLTQYFLLNEMVNK